MSAFEDFIQIELPRRPWVVEDPAQETVPVRRGAGPRQLDFVSLQDGEVLGKVNGVIQGINIGLTETGEIVHIPKNYIHVQSFASNVWNVAHNGDSLDYVVSVFDSNGSLILVDEIDQVDSNNVTITLGTAITGKAVFIFAS